MKVIITPTTFDPIGPVHLHCLPSASLGETRRRMNRIATLDGGAALNDFGYSEADRSIELRWQTKSMAHVESIDRLVRLYQRVHVATPQGFYLCAPEVHRPGASESSLLLLVVSKLA